MRGTHEVSDNYQIYRLTGLLDAFSEPNFRKVLKSGLEQGPNNIILDLSHIDFIDSSGIGTLVRIDKDTKAIAGTLQIIGNARVIQTIKLVRLENYLTLKPSLEEAIKSIK